MQSDSGGIDNAHQWGLVDPIAKNKRVYTCSFYKEKGHNEATCVIKKCTI